MTHWTDIDFERLRKVLFIKAVAVVRDASRCFDVGVSAEDLVQETLRDFLQSSDGLGWNKTKGSLENYLGGVLVHKARSHLRRDKKVAGSLDQHDHGFPVQDRKPTQDAQVEWDDFTKKLHLAVGDNKGLQDLIVAVDSTTGAHNVNQELADAMGKTPQEAVNLRRRLMSHRKVQDIYGKG